MCGSAMCHVHTVNHANQFGAQICAAAGANISLETKNIIKTDSVCWQKKQKKIVEKNGTCIDCRYGYGCVCECVLSEDRVTTAAVAVDCFDAPKIKQFKLTFLTFVFYLFLLHFLTQTISSRASCCFVCQFLFSD